MHRFWVNSTALSLCLLAFQAAAQPGPNVTPPVTVEAPGRVAVREMAEPTLDNFGITDVRAFGGSDLWQGTPADTVTQALDDLPDGIKSPVTRKIISLLLTANAEPPSGANSWLEARLNTLIRLGMLSDARAMLSSLPSAKRPLPVTIQHIQLALAQGEVKEACNLGKIIADQSQDEFWKQFQLYCSARTGNMAEVQMGFSMQEEQGQQPIEWFKGLIDSFQYEDTQITSLPDDISPLLRTMLLSAGGNHLPARFVEKPKRLTPPPIEAWQIASTTGFTDDQRARAIEQLLAVGSAKAEDFMDIYLGLGAGSAHAALYQQAAELGTSREQLKKLEELMQLFRVTSQRRGGHALIQPQLRALGKTLKPESPYSSLAPEAFVALATSGNPADARPWLAMMDKHKGNSVAVYVGYELLRFMQPDSHVSSTAKILPPVEIAEDTPTHEILQLSRLYQLLPLFGYTVPQENLAKMAQQNLDFDVELPDDTLLAKLTTPQGAVGDRLLSIVSALGKQDLSQTSDQVVLLCVKNLLALKQESLARQLVVEAVLAHAS